MIIPEAIIMQFYVDVAVKFLCNSNSPPRFYEIVDGKKRDIPPMIMTKYIARLYTHIRNRVIHCQGTLEDGTEFIARAYFFGAGKSNKCSTSWSFFFCSYFFLIPIKRLQVKQYFYFYF